MRLPSLCLLLATTTGLGAGQVLSRPQSFGQTIPISEDRFSILGWSIRGEGHVPQLLSDKVVVTPPIDGNKRGALWTDSTNDRPEWTITTQFRASGQDRAGGNLNFWYVKDGAETVSTSSVYTVNKFDGLAIVVDTVGGVQKIRGFLNDGNTDYRAQQSIEGLAFGHCDYDYRNLGRTSELQIKMDSTGLTVTIDGDACFASSQIDLPTGYNFGVTAASSDPPDSFEVWKFLVNSAASGHSQTYTAGLQDAAGLGGSTGGGGGGGDYSVRLLDLSGRLSAITTSLERLQREMTRQGELAESRQKEIIKQFGTSQSAGNIDSRLTNMERLMNDLHFDAKSTDQKSQFDKLSKQIQTSHVGITEHLPGKMKEYVQSHTPRIGFIAFSFMAFQSCCLALLLWQKYRKSTMPKKYL